MKVISARFRVGSIRPKTRHMWYYNKQIEREAVHVSSSQLRKSFPGGDRRRGNGSPYLNGSAIRAGDKRTIKWSEFVINTLRFCPDLDGVKSTDGMRFIEISVINTGRFQSRPSRLPTEKMLSGN